MLSESEAWALLELYCEPLRGGEWANIRYLRNQQYHSMSYGRVDFVPVVAKATSTRHARSLGARLRLALGVVQAISSCRGFDPATNMAFWRHAVATLWLKDDHSADRLVLSRKSFSHVGIQWNFDSPDDDTFWIGFFYGTPACDAVLSAVQSKLRPHLEVEQLPPLEVTPTSCLAYGSIRLGKPYSTDLDAPPDVPHGVVNGVEVSPRAMWSILRAAQITPVVSTWSNAPCRVGLVLEYEIGLRASAMRHTLALLKRGVAHEHLQLSINRLRIEMVPLLQPRAADSGTRSRRALVTRGRPLGELLRGLLITNESIPCVRTVSLTGCSYTDYRHVGAVLSAVALATPPVVELHCSGLFDGSAHRDHILRLAWLAFALHRRARTTNSQLKLVLLSAGVTINERECDYITQLLALGTPLRDVVGESLRLRFGGDDDEVARLVVDCARVGSTVQLARGTQLCIEPFRGENECVAVTTDRDHAETLDLVAHVADDLGEPFVGVVYAGFGLVWAPAASVLSQHQVDVADTSVSNRLVLSSVVLQIECAGLLPPKLLAVARRVTGLLSFLRCESLTSLTLDTAVVSRDDLALVLNCFPRLKSLSLYCCIVESVEPLVAAYRRGTTMLSKLSLLGVRDVRYRDQWLLCRSRGMKSIGMSGTDTLSDVAAWIRSFLDTVTSDTNCQRTLRDLRLDLRTTTDPKVLDRLAQAVSSGALPLQRLHVMSERPWKPPLAPKLFEPLRDAVLRDPPRVRCAVLSVLRARGCGTREVAGEVLAMAEGGVRRRITWGSPNAF